MKPVPSRSTARHIIIIVITGWRVGADIRVPGLASGFAVGMTMMALPVARGGDLGRRSALLLREWAATFATLAAWSSSGKVGSGAVAELTPDPTVEMREVLPP
jgi:hypothetical protein